MESLFINTRFGGTYIGASNKQVVIAEGESGIFVTAGNQFDQTSTTVVDYVSAGKNNSKQRGQSTHF